VVQHAYYLSLAELWDRATQNLPPL
jgi:hypothetical protein